MLMMIYIARLVFIIIYYSFFFLSILYFYIFFFFFFSSRRRHTRSDRDWSSDVCSSDLHKRNFFICAIFFRSNIYWLVRESLHFSNLFNAIAKMHIISYFQDKDTVIKIGRASCRERV